MGGQPNWCRSEQGIRHRLVVWCGWCAGDAESDIYGFPGRETPNSLPTNRQGQAWDARNTAVDRISEPPNETPTRRLPYWVDGPSANVQTDNQNIVRDLTSPS